MYKENEKEIEAKLRDFFAMQDIKLAFLIGSYAKGTARPDSDVDVAVLFGRSFDVKQVLDLKEQLTELVGVDVDLIVLDSVGSVMKMQVLKTGILLHADDAALLHHQCHCHNVHMTLNGYPRILGFGLCHDPA